MKNALLASDLDGTLIPARRTQAQQDALRTLRRRLRTHPHVALAYVTGRSLSLTLQGMRTHELPSPDILVCDVGTTIYVRDGRTWSPHPRYRRRMREAMGGHKGADVARALMDLPGIVPQEPERQTEFKQSYYAEAGADLDDLARRMRRRLTRHGIHVAVVSSHDPKTDIGLLDVLPRGAAKDFALHYLQRMLRLAQKAVLYAGDSGNDLLAFQTGFRAIVVGNTPPSVKEAVLRHARAHHREDRIYIARGHAACGVLDGCRHFGLFPNAQP